MNDLNLIIIEGRIVKEPQFFVSTRGTSGCQIRIASHQNRLVDDEWVQETDFIGAKLFDKKADNLRGATCKGRLVRLVGKLKMDAWNDRQGKPQTRHYLLVSKFEYVPEHKGSQEKQNGAQENVENSVIEVADEE